MAALVVVCPFRNLHTSMYKLNLLCDTHKSHTCMFFTVCVDNLLGIYMRNELLHIHVHVMSKFKMQISLQSSFCFTCISNYLYRPNREISLPKQGECFI